MLTKQANELVMLRAALKEKEGEIEELKQEVKELEALKNMMAHILDIVQTTVNGLNIGRD